VINIHNKKLAGTIMAQTGEAVAVRRDILVCKIDLISIQTPPKVSVHLPLYKRGIEGDLSNKISPNPSFPKRGD